MDLPFGFPRYMEEQWDPFSGAADLSAFGNQIQQPRQAHQFQRHPAQGPQNHMDPSQGHPRYPYWSQSWMDACGQPPRAVVVNGGNIGGLHAPKQNEPKPRLSKEEVDSLEKEFLKNAKPNSSTKRELAERLQVEVPRINNWFQNRRAKEKQIKKTREFEAQQARERAASESKSSEDGGVGIVSEFYGLANLHQPAGPSSATIGEDDEDGEEGSCGANEQEEEEREGNEKGIGDVLGNGIIGSQQPNMEGIKGEATTSETTHDYCQHQQPTASNSNNLDFDGYASLPLTARQDTAGMGTSGSEDDFHAIQIQRDFQTTSELPFNLTIQTSTAGLPAATMADITSSQPQLMTSDALMFDDLQTSEYFGNPSIHSFLPGGIHDTLVDEPMASIEPLSEDDVKIEHSSPASMSHSPHPLTDQRFKSPPPPTDIAARRNIRRPPSLGLGALRNFSHSGPKTCIDVSRRPDVPPPMRRMTSSSLLSGRIQKSGPAPRSPFSLDRSRTALLQTLQGTSAPGLSSLNCALSPLSPSGLNLGDNSTPTGLTDEDRNFGLGSLGGSCSKSEQPMRTPPPTPGLPSNFQEPIFYFQLDQHWNSAPQDEPLQTPSLGSHGGSEFDFPGYVVSQPATPSLPLLIGPAQGLQAGVQAKAPSNVEYNFPDSFPGYSARSSPGQPKSQQFQFAQNVTPQDFNMR